MKKSVIYDENTVKRRIRGEHSALGLEPSAERFEGGNFHTEGDNHLLCAVFMENRHSLIVCSTSFNRDDWSCVICEKDLPPLPLRDEREFLDVEGSSSSSWI
jgi:hypothetical protein